MRRLGTRQDRMATHHSCPQQEPKDLAHTLLSLFTALLMPGLLWAAAYVFARVGRALDVPTSELILLLLTMPIPLCLGYVLAHQASLPATLFQRIAPMLVPLWLLLAAAGPIIWWMQSELRFLIQVLATLVVAYGLYVLSFAWKSEQRQVSTLRARSLVCLCGLFLLTGGSMGVGWYTAANNTLYDNPSSHTVGYGIATYRYQPFIDNNFWAPPATPPTLRIAINHPKLDGAIALLPVYGAVVQAVYTDLTVEEQDNKLVSSSWLHDVVRCRDTSAAYQALIDNKVDLFFGMPPSPKQLEIMKRHGLHPVIKPIAREAFVFFVHKDNPILNLSQEQIRGVYAGRMSNWNQVGGLDAMIMPFQRPEDSDSQTAMQQIVMRGLAMTKPIRHEYKTARGEFVNQVADYRNWPDALGYSFRWHVTEQFLPESIRFLSVDNVFPTPETIRDGTYPYIVPLVIVSCRPLSRESKELIDWITGVEGQALIARTGYVPLQ